MGGALFKADRIPNREYHNLQSSFKEKFLSLGRQALFPLSFRNKEDHGDLDIIVGGESIPNEELKKIFNLQDDWISRNTSVTSIFYQGKYQVDLCFHPVEFMFSAFNYNRNGDCGNLIGRLYHQLGFKLGHKGLLYPVNISDRECLGEIIILQDWYKILTFVGLDYPTWLRGFDSQEKLFEWICTSPYFNAELFKFENLNHVNRIRNRKRPVYASFVEWCDTRVFENNYTVKKNKAEYLWKAVVEFEQFDLLDRVNGMLHEAYQVRAANALFNGHLVCAWTGLQGKSLGRVIAAFRAKLQLRDEEDWRSWRLFRSREKIEEEFMKFYSVYKELPK